MGTSVTMFKCDDVQVGRHEHKKLRCKPYTDKKHLYFGRKNSTLDKPHVSLCLNKTRYSFNLRLACMIFWTMASVQVFFPGRDWMARIILSSAFHLS